MTVAAIVRRSTTVLATVREDDNIQSIAAKLAEPDAGAVVVLDPSGAMSGIITEHDLAPALAAGLPALGTIRARDFMTRDVVTCGPRDTEMRVMTLMAEKQIRHMPVLVEGKVAAMITLPEVVKYRLWKIGRLADAAAPDPGEESAQADQFERQLRKLPAEVRRNQIVEVARQVIVQKGMKGFTVRSIAKEAGLSPGMISLHFGSIEGLLRAVFDSVMFELPDTTAREPVNLTVAIINLRMIVKRYFDPQYFSRASLLVWLPLFDAMLRDPDFRKKVYARDEDYVSEFAAHVEKVMAFRRIAGDPMAVARNLMSFMDGLWLRWCHSERGDTRAEQAAAMEYLEGKVGSLEIDGA